MARFVKSYYKIHRHDIFTQCLLSSNGSYDKDIFCVWFIESNSLQADVGKIHITALKLLVPVGEVILT